MESDPTELEWTSQTHVLLRSLSQTPAAGRVGQAGVGSGRAARAALAPHPSAPAAASSASASAARAARPPMRRQRRDRGVVAGAQSGAPLHVRLQRRVRRSLPPPTSTKPGPTTAPSHSPLGASPVHPPARQALALPASPLTLFPYHFLPTGAAAGGGGGGTLDKCATRNHNPSHSRRPPPPGHLTCCGRGSRAR